MTAPAIPNMPNIGIPSIGITSDAIGSILGTVWQFIEIFVVFLIFVIFLALWRGWGENLPGWGKFVKKFHHKLNVIRRDGNNLKLVVDHGRDFIKDGDQMMEVQSDGEVIPGGIRGDLILYSPAPGKYMPATLELADKESQNPTVLLHSLHDDAAARIIFVSKQREIRNRFNLKGWLEKWGGIMAAFIALFIIVFLLMNSWGNVTSTAALNAQTVQKITDVGGQLAQIINRTYAPAIPGGH